MRGTGEAQRTETCDELLDQLRQALRTKHYSCRTEQCYVRWTVQYLRFRKRGDEGRQ